jgi:glycosyltransferase involved in cell wall biosynthesis
MAKGDIKVNGRFYAHRPTGMQRYALEVSKRFPASARIVRPRRALRGSAGHMWEQLYLPLATGGDLLWSPNNTGPLAVSRQICTIHDVIPLDRPEWFATNFVALYRWLLPRLTKKLQHIIAISHFTKSRVVNLFGIDANKVTVIPNGVDAAFRPHTPEEIQELRTALGLDRRPYVLCVGSVEPRKNLKTLLRAWTMLSKWARDEHQLVIAGPEGNSVVFRDAGIGEVPPGVRFTGYVAQEQLPVLYAGAAVFVYPSLYEGFGLPPLEAMASGVPVVTSGTSSIPEVVGQGAVLVNPDEPEDIAKHLECVLANEDLRRSLSERGLARARELTWESTAVQTWRVLAEQAAN